jgi:hypothetical protein
MKRQSMVHLLLRIILYEMSWMMMTSFWCNKILIFNTRKSRRCRATPRHQIFRPLSLGRGHRWLWRGMTGVDLDPTISTYLVLGEVGTRQKEESVKSYPPKSGPSCLWRFGFGERRMPPFLAGTGPWLLQLTLYLKCCRHELGKRDFDTDSDGRQLL